ncbi:aspartate/glutamate racemase family protein [Hoeflea alexandrii]|uniref:aspartate/glutamate racemase family protein n=1 Tax=Hoeflea alexandrii TaxID=288436 RepID=UPI0022B06DCE|nr:aspartate/glutamate racemase family protein [Hoeflea alexandrii]MCZ4291626.1 aspartate/glutamate racemase family protein [Hoeflea alexandrii]
MRLCWIHPTTRIERLERLWGRIEASILPVLRPDCQLEFRFLPASGNFTRSLYAEHLNSVHMIEAAIRAEADGIDGIFLGCWNDALWETREILSVPVASVGEQSMLWALTMGRRFAVVTVSPKTADSIENDLISYGLSQRAIHWPVRSISPVSDTELLCRSAEDPRAEFIPRFELTARECIADGAEVIIVGCGYYGPLLRSSGYLEVPGTGVPVLDSSAIGLKSLEAMVDTAGRCGYVKSRANALRPPEPEALANARASLGLFPAAGEDMI